MKCDICFVHLNTEFTVDIELCSGKTYFATVEACNGVLLCSMAVSHELVVDTSSPIRGIVYVGHNREHDRYLSNA